MKFTTKAVHVGEKPDFKKGQSADVVTPIHLSSTYAKKDCKALDQGYEYSRTGNPTREVLEKKLAALENAEFALAFSSGVAAETTLLLSLLKSGDHIIAFEDIYGGTQRLFDSVLPKFGVKTTFVDATDINNIKKNIKPETRLFWMETPTNPLLRICDIKEISRLAAQRNIITVVDNTFMTPFFQNPLDLGADIVVHSATKYLGGHSDVIAGAIVLSDKDYYEMIKSHQNSVGAVLSPFDSYLLLRGLKTLSVRMERHQYNAVKIAEFLSTHPKVRRVSYPGLSGHPQHELAKRQMSGFGGMLSFVIDGQPQDVEKFLKQLSLFSFAVSLGGVESLIAVPGLMLHSVMKDEDKERVGLTDTLVRVSVGIEDAEDLISDISGALSHLE